jgi:hypothetical protein
MAYSGKPGGHGRSRHEDPEYRQLRGVEAPLGYDTETDGGQQGGRSELDSSPAPAGCNDTSGQHVVAFGRRRGGFRRIPVALRGLSGYSGFSVLRPGRLERSVYPYERLGPINQPSAV